MEGRDIGIVLRITLRLILKRRIWEESTDGILVDQERAQWEADVQSNKTF